MYERTWAKTALAGTAPFDEDGVASIEIEVKHDFVAQRVTFEGTPPSAFVTYICVGSAFDEMLGPLGVGMFAPLSPFCSIVKGHKIMPGARRIFVQVACLDAKPGEMACVAFEGLKG